MTTVTKRFSGNALNAVAIDGTACSLARYGQTQAGGIDGIVEGKHGEEFV